MQRYHPVTLGRVHIGYFMDCCVVEIAVEIEVSYATIVMEVNL